MTLLYDLFKIGYDKEGYDRNGFDKAGYDRSGYNKLGVDRNGFNKLGYDRNGYDSDSYDRDGYNQGKNKFIDRLERYELNKKDSEIYLAECYIKGIGVIKDSEKAFSLIVGGAYNNSVSALRILGDYYYAGIIVTKNVDLAKFIYSLADGENTSGINQYKAMMPTTFKRLNKENEKIQNQEEKHLATVVFSIENEIRYLESNRIQTNGETWWMDRDQLDDWRIDKARNRKSEEKIYNLEKIKAQPYYARMDSILSDSVQTHYIGEETYFSKTNPETNVLSVWSEYGRRYRAKNEHEFFINGNKYQVTLRRRFDITNSKINKIFEEYIAGSSEAEAQITDPYLLRVLEQKKGEPQITNIIRSIQLNQNDIIEYPFNESLIVQGCAGSGKTMILLHRLANMKYNMPNLDLTKIKIITPNSQFNLFIDELSKNLKIDDIEKNTLDDYYISLLGKYRRGNQERYTKIVERRINGGIIEQEELASRETGPSEKDELKTVSKDIDLEFEIVNKIYSNEFAEKLMKESRAYKKNKANILDYGSVMLDFNNVFTKVLNEVGISKTPSRNYTCVLYSKILFMFTYYGEISRADSLLCVDEGQDISLLQYELMKKVNGNSIKFNIYGDLNQQIPGYYGIGNWERLSLMVRSEIFVLNENYRNSENVINFYNNKLGFDNKSFGLRTKPIETINLKNIVTEIKLQIVLKNRTAIIIKQPAILPEEIMGVCSSEVLARNKAVLLTVREAKGLEFDTVFVFDMNMNKNERYVAYSRALSELYIVSDENNVSK